ncbi:hypothetical protein PITC_089910 [Penicillium italicum]|uniref:Beta-galactosidase jelly roll domain-containing protein n=1 Tax=Penicillium italicum TaxID=40296 RepID=A0A0A2L9L4_PENIT|nr:hypothetical protein PITC_089910 [Penicillium italicum]
MHEVKPTSTLSGGAHERRRSGLYGERLRWYLPGYKDLQDSDIRQSSETMSLAPQTGSTRRPSSLMWTPTSTFRLVCSSVHLIRPAVVLIILNGYQFGHYLPHIGPQTRFPLPPGMISNLGEGGENTLAVSR